MTHKELDPLKEAHFPLKKPEVLANAIDQDLSDECVETLAEELDNDHVYNNVKDIEEKLDHKNKD